MKQTLDALKQLVDARLEELMAEREPSLLWLSMAYSVRAGGKRLRPALVLLSNGLLKGDQSEALDLACAVEMIHTYSLIHDDLPALDNDTLRRGAPTNHMVFGEAQAILAGDGLLNYAYEVMLKNASHYPARLAAHLRAISAVAAGAGVGGMIAGQVMDVHLEGQKIGEAELSYIHAHKTGDMILASLLAGAELQSPSEEQREAILSYGKKLGLVFQIVDDVLDVTADQQLGKTLGKDAASGKTTYASLYGVEESMRIAREKTERAKDALGIFGGRAGALCELADHMLNRRK